MALIFSFLPFFSLLKQGTGRAIHWFLQMTSTLHQTLGLWGDVDQSSLRNLLYFLIFTGYSHITPVFPGSWHEIITVWWAMSGTLGEQLLGFTYLPPWTHTLKGMWDATFISSPLTNLGCELWKERKLEFLGRKASFWKRSQGGTALWSKPKVFLLLARKH